MMMQSAVVKDSELAEEALLEQWLFEEICASGPGK